MSSGNVGGVSQRRGGSRYQSLFYRDLDIVPSGKVRGGAVSATPAALWRDSISGGGAADPPPPPCFTLEERVDRTPEPMTGVEQQGGFRSPSDSLGAPKTPLPSSTGAFGGSDSAPRFLLGSPPPPPIATPTSTWWSPIRERSLLEGDSNAASGAGTSLQHQQQQQQQQTGLLTLPTPRDIIRPDSESSFAPPQGEEGDEWVTIYGFPGEDTNSVLREFEKCGPIVRHVAGPPNSNWLHIQYESRLDAYKALLKNGMQLYGALIIGVKRVDPMQRQVLLGINQKPAFAPKAFAAKSSAETTTRPYYLTDSAAKPSSTIASPSKSILSTIADYVFGF